MSVDTLHLPEQPKPFAPLAEPLNFPYHPLVKQDTLIDFWRALSEKVDHLGYQGDQFIKDISPFYRQITETDLSIAVARAIRDSKNKGYSQIGLVWNDILKVGMPLHGQSDRFMLSVLQKIGQKTGVAIETVGISQITPEYQQQKYLIVLDDVSYTGNQKGILMKLLEKNATHVNLYLAGCTRFAYDSMGSYGTRNVVREVPTISSMKFPDSTIKILAGLYQHNLPPDSNSFSNVFASELFWTQTATITPYKIPDGLSFCEGLSIVPGHQGSNRLFIDRSYRTTNESDIHRVYSFALNHVN